jgi:hypothetical protein
MTDPAEMTEGLVPGERFELPTNGLQNRCSTTELTRQINKINELDFTPKFFAPFFAP